MARIDPKRGRVRNEAYSPPNIITDCRKVKQRLRHEDDFKQAIEKIEIMLTKKRKKKYLITYA